jgi:hypothetical protein
MFFSFLEQKEQKRTKKSKKEKELKRKGDVLGGQVDQWDQYISLI